MKLLLDTHVFIWLASEPERLSEAAARLLLDSDNELCLSVASLWEMQIKLQLGKLSLELPLRQIWEEQQRLNQVQLVGISGSHVWQLEALAQIHKDPFDRIIIAQARQDELTLVSADGIVKRYDVDVVW